MRKLRDLFAILGLGLICLLLLRATGALPRADRLWVGGVELSGGGSLPFGGGTASYAPETRTLTLTNAEISGGREGPFAAGIFSESDLFIRLEGRSRVSGAAWGLAVLGDLTVFGGGSLEASGGKGGAAVRACLSVFDRAQLSLAGEKPLAWGKLHASPMTTVERTDALLRVRAPYVVTLRDALVDAAGHPLAQPGFFRSYEWKLGEPAPEPAEPERAGYWFGGWYADEGLSEPFDFTLPREDDVTLFARWIQIVRLSFDAWGGSETPDVCAAWGDAPLPPEAPARAGYAFAGWYADSGLAQEADFAQPLTGDLTFYAKWDKLADSVSFGVDVASYQKDVDWEAAAADGVRFVFLRVGFRGYGATGSLNPDDYFAQNYERAVAAGLDVGVYFFSQAISEEEAREEAEYVLALLDGRSLALPVVLDYELASEPSGKLLGRLYDAGLTGEEYGRICLRFCTAIEEKGYTAAVYAGRDMLEGGVEAALLGGGGFPVWLANWTVQTRYNGGYDYWQYASTGRVAGIEGDVDVNLRYLQQPEQVTGLVSNRGEDLNFLYWDRQPGVRGYIVYRSEPGSGGYAELARCDGASSTTFTDRAAPEGCKYMVCAYLRSGGKDLLGPFSAASE